jgi:hypothetical protein
VLCCRYDGGEWIYGDEPEHEIIDGRLADCAVSSNVPLSLVEKQQADGSWKPIGRKALAGLRRKLGR